MKKLFSLFLAMMTMLLSFSAAFANDTPEITEPVTLQAIAISRLPVETLYYVGETLDTTGLLVTALYSDGSQREITDYEYSPKALNVKGIQQVTVYYTEGEETFSTYFFVAVEEKQNIIIDEDERYIRLKVGYRTTITFFSNPVRNPVAGGTIHWYINGKDEGTGEKITVDKVTTGFTVQAKYLSNGRVLTETEIISVKVKTSFFARLVAFFQSVVGLLPVTEVVVPGGMYAGYYVY